MHTETPLSFSIEPIMTNGPLDTDLSVIILTDRERRHLLELLRGQETGPGASARLKLRTACPVHDAAWGRPRWSVIKRAISWLFECDGREWGKCRWCRRRARIDQYELCAGCFPDSGSRLGKAEPPMDASRSRPDRSRAASSQMTAEITPEGVS